MLQLVNRAPWNAVAGVVLIVTILLGLARISLWVPFALVALVAVPVLRIWGARFVQLRRKGYFGGRLSRGKWLYEETSDGGVRSLSLPVEYTEPGRHEIFIPSDDEWRASVPEWASARRLEIAHRIAERWKAVDFHMAGQPLNDGAE